MRTPIYHQYVPVKKVECITYKGREYCEQSITPAEMVTVFLLGLVLGTLFIAILFKKVIVI